MKQRTEHPLVLRRRPTPTVRCPYCLDPIHNGRVTCPRCGARHHSPCAEETLACCTCGEGLSWEVRVAAIERVEREYSWYQRVGSNLTAWTDGRVSLLIPRRRDGGTVTAVTIVFVAFVSLVLYLALR